MNNTPNTTTENAVNSATVTFQAIAVSHEFIAGMKPLQMLGYKHGHEYQAAVPKADPSYILRKDFLREYRSWHNNCGEEGFMIVGPTGSGKSTAPLAINALLNIPTLLVPCHRDMTLLELKGNMQFVTDPMTNQTVTKYVLGPLARAFKYGLSIIMDEQNLLDPGVLTGFNEIIRGNTMLIEQTGEIIQRHPMFRYIATGNDWGRGDGEMRYAGINFQNTSNLQRFWKFSMGYPEAAVEEVILATKYPVLLEPIVKGMVSIANAVRSVTAGVGNTKEASLEVDFSTRTLLSWADKTIRFQKAGNALALGLDICLLRACDEVERQAINQICKDKLGDAFKEV